MRDSPSMRELKEGFDKLGIKYEVDDFENHDEDGDTYIQGITWDVNDTTMKAMYGWCVDYNGDSAGVTLGWKFGYLEWWPNGVDGQSFIATPEEIIEAVT